jgi:uncharacterized protein (DUF2236 family)
LEILVHGLDQPRGISAIRNINRIHRQVASLVDDPGRVSLMSNENFIYVLGTFFIPSIRWIDKYAWRPLSKNEQAGTFAHFRELGSRLGVKDIPPSYEAFVQGFDAYERERMRYTPASGKLWNAGEELLADKLADSLPWPFSRSDFLCRKLADWSVCSLLDDAVRIALGAPRAPMLVRWAVVAVMKCHGKVVRFMRPRKSPLISKGVFVTATE